MDAVVKPGIKPSTEPWPRGKLSDHVHNAPAPVEKRPSQEEAEAAVRALIAYIGEDPAREGLVDTPKRVIGALEELYRGYREIPADALARTFGETEAYDDFVLIRDIRFTSHCEHHMLPFYGKMHVAYLPKSKVIGLSKIPRIVDAYARRLQIQERLTQQVAQTIQEMIDPVGVGVICEARHFCMMMRGVEKQHSGAVTSAMLGAFRSRKTTRDEFLALVSH